MRTKICSNSAASWVDETMRCMVWQPTHWVRNPFCLSAPGRLISHSPLEICAVSFFVLLSLRSAVAPAATSTPFGPSSW